MTDRPGAQESERSLAIHVLHETHAERIAAAVRAAAPGRRVVVAARASDLVWPELEVLFAVYPPRTGYGAAPRLRLVQLLSAGANTLLPAPDLPPGVLVAGLGDELAAETSEYAIAGLLALGRALPTLLERQARRLWKPFASPALAGSTLAVLGLGAVGQRVARVGAALGMRVLGLRRHPRPTPHVEEVVGERALRDLLARADHVVVALPLTPETRGLLDARALGCLRPTALFVNVARGAIVDEAALEAMLRAGRLGGAVLDAFAEEPLPASSGLWDAPNTLVTPHLAGLGLRYVERAAAVLADAEARLERGEPLRHPIDRALGYHADESSG